MGMTNNLIFSYDRVVLGVKADHTVSSTATSSAQSHRKLGLHLVELNETVADHISENVFDTLLDYLLSAHSPSGLIG